MIFIKKNFKALFFLLIFGFTIYSSYLILTTSLQFNSDNSLVLLASRFLSRHIALLPNQSLPLGDVSDYFNNFYLYFGPFPSIVLMPLVLLFGLNFPQVWLGIGSIIASFILIYLISKHFNFNKIDSLWLSLFFVFSTVVFSAGLIDISAYQVEVLGVPLVLFALYEYLTRKRPLLIGLFLGLAVMTRITLIFSVVFFIFEFLYKRISKRQLVILLIPILISLILLGLYNQRRFHSFFELGYKYSINLSSYPLSNNLKYGYISPIHIPGNLYAMLVMPPEPLLKDKDGFVLKFPYLKVSPWGLAIWYTSPLFLFLLFRFKRNVYSISALVTTIILLIPILLYFSIGFAQFGYRYELDFLPFLFLLLIPCLPKKLSKPVILLITFGVIFNCLYITSLWGVYPQFGIHF